MGTQIFPVPAPCPWILHCFLIYLTYQILVLLSKAKSQAVQVIKGHTEVPQRNFLGSCKCFDPARYLKSLGKQDSDTLGMCVWKTNLSFLRAPSRASLQAHRATSPRFPEELSWSTRWRSLQIARFSLSRLVFV